LNLRFTIYDLRGPAAASKGGFVLKDSWIVTAGGEGELNLRFSIFDLRGPAAWSKGGFVLKDSLAFVTTGGEGGLNLRFTSPSRTGRFDLRGPRFEVVEGFMVEMVRGALGVERVGRSILGGRVG